MLGERGLPVEFANPMVYGDYTDMTESNADKLAKQIDAAIKEAEVLSQLVTLLDTTTASIDLITINALINDNDLPISRTFFVLENPLITDNSIMALKNYVESTWMDLLKDLVKKNFMIEGTPIHNSLHSSYNYVLKD
jgi:hypothetical protein